MARQDVIVTGASGFIGSALIDPSSEPAPKVFASFQEERA